MRTLSGSPFGPGLRLSILVLTFLFMLAGCKKDDSSLPTSPSPIVTYPSVAGNWKGNAIWDQGVSGQFTFLLEANITQGRDTLGGNWKWTSGKGTENVYSVQGTITKSGTLALTETSQIVWWRPLVVYTAVLSSKRDTISGTSTNSAALITFTLVRQ